MVCMCASVALTLTSACGRESPQAAPADLDEGIGYGSVMVVVGHRFELVGRAAVARRYELAAFELDEIVEEFETTLPHAKPPREGNAEVLKGLEIGFVGGQVPDLRRALSEHDDAKIQEAFGRVAAACNACHEASGHAFIEIPSVPGHGVPDTDPASP
jgi:hypothetical protein